MNQLAILEGKPDFTSAVNGTTITVTASNEELWDEFFKGYFSYARHKDVASGGERNYFIDSFKQQLDAFQASGRPQNLQEWRLFLLSDTDFVQKSKNVMNWIFRVLQQTLNNFENFMVSRASAITLPRQSIQRANELFDTERARLLVPGQVPPTPDPPELVQLNADIAAVQARQSVVADALEERRATYNNARDLLYRISDGQTQEDVDAARADIDAATAANDQVALSAATSLLDAIRYTQEVTSASEDLEGCPPHDFPLPSALTPPVDMDETPIASPTLTIGGDATDSGGGTTLLTPDLTGNKKGFARFAPLGTGAPDFFDIEWTQKIDGVEANDKSGEGMSFSFGPPASLNEVLDFENDGYTEGTGNQGLVIQFDTKDGVNKTDRLNILFMGNTIASISEQSDSAIRFATGQDSKMQAHVYPHPDPNSTDALLSITIDKDGAQEREVLLNTVIPRWHEEDKSSWEFVWAGQTGNGITQTRNSHEVKAISGKEYRIPPGSAPEEPATTIRLDSTSYTESFDVNTEKIKSFSGDATHWLRPNGLNDMEIQLNPDATGKGGYVILDPPLSGKGVGEFDITWRQSIMEGDGPFNSADGLSYNYGLASTLPSGGDYENGVSTGIAVGFKHYGNDHVIVKYNGTELDNIPITVYNSSANSSNNDSDNPIVTVTKADPSDTDATLRVQFKTINKTYTLSNWNPQDNWEHILAARTGANKAIHSVDDVTLEQTHYINLDVTEQVDTPQDDLITTTTNINGFLPFTSNMSSPGITSNFAGQASASDNQVTLTTSSSGNGTFILTPPGGTTAQTHYFEMDFELDVTGAMTSGDWIDFHFADGDSVPSIGQAASEGFSWNLHADHNFHHIRWNGTTLYETSFPGADQSNITNVKIKLEEDSGNPDNAKMTIDWGVADGSGNTSTTVDITDYSSGEWDYIFRAAGTKPVALKNGISLTALSEHVCPDPNVSLMTEAEKQDLRNIISTHTGSVLTGEAAADINQSNLDSAAATWVSTNESSLPGSPAVLDTLMIPDLNAIDTVLTNQLSDLTQQTMNYIPNPNAPIPGNSPEELQVLHHNSEARKFRDIIRRWRGISQKKLGAVATQSGMINTSMVDMATILKSITKLNASLAQSILKRL